MPTTNRDFRVKNGLVVEGATATVNGSNVVTESSTSTLTNKTLTSPILTTPSIGAASGTSLSLTTALSATSGGTGQATYTTGDILISSATNTLSKLAAVTSGYVLTSNGVGTAPSWQVSGGGTSLPSQTGNAGELLTTDGTSASWSNTLIANATTSVGLVVRGLASQTADLLQVQNSAGTTLFEVNSAGNVGIGTTTPTNLLEVSANLSGGALVARFTNSSTANNTTKYASFLFGGADTVGTAKPTGSILVGPVDANYVTSYMAFATRTADVVTERMRIDNAGNVGIGVTAPATRLDVLGTQVLNRGVLQVIDTTAQAAGTGAGITLGGVWNTGGSTTTGVQIKASKTNATSGDYSYDMVFLNYLNGNVDMTERMRITSAGNVGIGTSSPTYTLDVAGTTGQLRVTSSTGTNQTRLQVSNTGGSFQFGIDSSTGNNFGLGNYSRVIWNDGAHPLVLTTNSAARLTIGSTGTSTFTGQIASTLANNTADGGGQLYLNGATGNRIDFNTAGVAAPAFTTRSAGTKIVLYPSLSASAADFALGIQSGSLWQSVENSSAFFRWYAGTTQVASLSGAGVFTAVSKSFDIEHPTKPDMRLRYGSLEGPENGVYIRGKSKNKTIQLPDYWTGLVHEDSITVNLTSIGSGTIYVEEVVDNTVKVGGTSKEFFFTIYGERKDVDKLTVEY